MSFLFRVAKLARARLSRHAPLIDQRSIADLYRSIWTEAATELSASVTVLPDGILEVTRGAQRTRLRESLLMIDHPGTVALCRSKAVVYRLLSEHGLPIPEFRPFELGNLRPALELLGDGSTPCVVKPRHSSSGGDGVTTNVRSRADLTRAALYAWLYCRDLVIERQVPGDCYRLLYLDGELLDAVYRPGPAVTGDGRSTIRQLITAENDRRNRLGGRAANRRITLTPDCRASLGRAGYSLRSILPAGETLRVKTASNEAAERDCESVLHRIGAGLAREGAEAAATLEVGLCGLDVITSDPERPLAETGGAIIDVNAVPGLQYHYQVRNPHDVTPVAVPILRFLLERSKPAIAGWRRPAVALTRVGS